MIMAFKDTLALFLVDQVDQLPTNDEQRLRLLVLPILYEHLIYKQKQNGTFASRRIIRNFRKMFYNHFESYLTFSLRIQLPIFFTYQHDLKVLFAEIGIRTD